MPSDFILTYEEKRNIQNNLCDDISFAKERLQELKQYYRVLGLDLPMSSYTNFRDALFHYTKVCEHSNSSTIIGNIYSINEHLQRGIKDALLRLLNNIVDWLEYFCIEHEVDTTIKATLDSKFPNITNTSSWNEEFFIEMRTFLKDDFLQSQDKKMCFDEQEMYRSCLSYCAEIIQNNDLQCVLRLRCYMHHFKNQSLKIRSASSILENPYDDNSEFDSLLDYLEQFYRYMERKHLNYTSIFLFSNQTYY